MTVQGRRPLRLAFLGDLNSIHVRKWLTYFASRGHEVHAIASHYFDAGSLSGVHVTNITARPENQRSLTLSRLGLLEPLKALRNRVQAALPDDLVWRASDRAIASEEAEMVARYDAMFLADAARVAELVRQIEPDVFQSLRLYPEGILAREVDAAPWALMAWGQCISLWADRYPQVARLAREAVQRCTFYMVDNYRDIEDARRYGLRDAQPWYVTPSGGGVETTKLARAAANDAPTDPTFMTFRRIGGSFIDNLPVIRAIALMRKKLGIDANFVIYGTPSGPYYQQVRILSKRLGVWDAVEVRPPFRYSELADVVSRHDLIVSAATYDGTTNALIETMWLGGIPLNGDLAPIREWITHGENGYVFPMHDPEGIARVFAQALEDRPKHHEFRARNQAIIRERADYQPCMAEVENIYYRLAQ
jgi:glycosyltransferase involved in cell wall biosynthesis